MVEKQVVRNMGRILVTGAAGFIGGHLARSFAQQGCDVVTIDTRPLADSTSQFDSVVEFQGDIRDQELVARAMDGVDVVFHQAAMASVPESFADPALCTAVNVEGSAVILEQARLAGVKRLVMASTSAIYGDDPTPVKHEKLSPAPRSPYAVSKLAMEQLADVYARQYGMEMIALRYFNVYGPGQPAEGGYAAVIPAFFAALKSGKPAQIYGDGSQTRAFVYIDDVVKANKLAAAVDLETEGVAVANIASSEVTSITGVLNEIAGALSAEPRAEYHPWREGDIVHSMADVSRARKVLGFEATIDLHAGIRLLSENVVAESVSASVTEIQK